MLHIKFESWMQWFRRISHLNGLKFWGRRRTERRTGQTDGRKTGRIYRTLLKQVQQKGEKRKMIAASEKVYPVFVLPRLYCL